MEASLDLEPAKLDPAGDFRAREWFIFLCQKCSVLLELKISRARHLSAKRVFCGEGGLFASNLRLAYEPSVAFCEKYFELCEPYSS